MGYLSDNSINSNDTEKIETIDVIISELSSIHKNTNTPNLDGVNNLIKEVNIFSIRIFNDVTNIRDMLYWYSSLISILNFKIEY